MNNDKKNTAVDILFNELVSLGFIEYPDDELVQNRLREAKAMFEQQIKDAFNDGMLDTDNENIIFLDGKEYYKETYEQ
jgi:hypothetical protein